MTQLEGKHFLILVGNDYEDLELQYPRYRLLEAGAGVTLAGPQANTVYKGKHGYPVKSDASFEVMEASDFQGIVIPGGWMPDLLRRNEKVLQLVRDFNEAGQLIAAICHGGWIPISADVYKDIRVTGSPGIKDDLINAGAKWIDAPVVIDGHFVSSRRPDDLPQFMLGILEVMGVVPAGSAK